MGCKTVSQSYLKWLNLLVGISGVAILGYSAYLSSELEDFDEITDDFLLYGPIAFGVFLTLLAGFGFIGAQKNNKIMLLAYLGVTTMVTAFVFGTGIALLVYSGVLDEVQDGRAQEASSGVLERVSDFELSVFNKCCAQVFNGVDDVPICEEDENAQICIVDETRFDDTIANLGDQICDALSNIDIDGNPVVGDPADGGCGGGDAAVFVNAITQYLIDNVKPLGIMNLVLGIVLLLDLIATCVVLWSRKEDKEPEEKENDKTGPEIAA